MTSTPIQADHNSAPDRRPAWSVGDAQRRYGVDAWGDEHFRVSTRGTIEVLPESDPNRAIDLHEVVQSLARRGVEAPVLIRFPQLIKHRVARIAQAFDRAITNEGYAARYEGVYPIKVNQQRHIVEEVRDAARQHGMGLEAGSKPELMAVLGMTAGMSTMPIVCNGFKDADYAELVVLAAKLGRRIYPVVEKFSELERLIEQAERHDVRPWFGVRAKLSAPGTGRWKASGGERSKFGLFTHEMIEAVELLAQHGMADRLALLHSHLGSQICDIRHFKNAVTELAHLYCEMRRLGAGLTILDVGGGLAVDYDGSRSSAESSMNYSLDEYALDIVHRVRSVCDEARQPHPTLMSESGRALTAYGSVLVTDVPECARFEPGEPLGEEAIEKDDDGGLPQPILDLLDAQARARSDENLQSVYHDASAARDEMLGLFSLGYVSLPQRAAGERVFWSVGRAVLDEAHRRGESHEEFEALAQHLCDQYICNMSVFQSLPDAWAIGQVFPIAPIHRLDEEPSRSAILHDITCDSDGKLEAYVVDGGIAPVLPVHPLRAGERYYLGVFLVGAYQEILGDLHNLFGDSHAAHVRLDEAGRVRIDTIVEGDTVREVLGYVQIGAGNLCEAMERDAERAVDDERITIEEAAAIRRHYRDGMSAYTYLRSED